MSGSKLHPRQPCFTLLEVILAMFILAGALTALLGERQRSLQHSRRIIEQRQALHLATALLDQSQSSGVQAGVLSVPEGYHTELSDISYILLELSDQNFVERTISVATPSGEKFQLSRIIQP